jgi:tetratricopeptide (TPR) repeat protein
MTRADVILLAMLRIWLVALCCACAQSSQAVAPDRAMHAGRWDDALADLSARERAAADRGQPHARVALLVAISLVLLDEGLNRRADVSRALEPARRAWSLAEQLADGPLIADALDRVGMVRYWQWALGDPPSGDGPLIEAAALFERARSLRDGGPGLAYSHFHLGLIAEAQDRAAVARAHFARSLDLAGRDRRIASYALRHLAPQDEAAGRRDLAETRLRRSLELRRSLGWRAGAASGLTALAAFLHRSGRAAEARPLLREAIAVARQAGSSYYATRASHTLARLEEEAGDVAAAISVLQAARADVAALEPAGLRAEHATLLESLTRRCPSCTPPER